MSAPGVGAGLGLGRPPAWSSLLWGTAFVVAVVWYLLDPDGTGHLVHSVTTVACLLVMAVGPLRRGLRPRLVWWLPPVAGVLLAATVLDSVVDYRLGPFEYSDLVFIPAYVLLIGWLALLTRVVSDRDPATLFDTAAACVGSALGLWTGILAQLATAEELATGVVWAVYPPLDVVLIAFGVHLALGLRRVPDPLKWLLAGFVLWAFGDTTYAAIQVRLDEAYDIPWLEVVYLGSDFCLARAFSHPRLAELSPPPESRGPRTVRGRKAAVVLFTVTPAVLASAAPQLGTVDGVVRTVLMGTLLILLFVRVSRTVTALAAAQDESWWRATHDSLTGISNRAALFTAVEARLRDRAGDGLATAVVFFDCDDFKHVNDTWGHLAGDTLLIDLARRVEQRLRPEEAFARNGGDEFVVVAPVRDEDEAWDLAARVRSAFDSPLHIRADRTHPMTPSIGVVVVSAAEPVTPEELLGRADAAMYAGKQQGKGRVVMFDDDLARVVNARAAIGDRLGQVVDDDPCTIALQPVVGGPGYRTPLGWEALARWHDPVLGDVPPQDFVPVAQQLGLLGRLGVGVLRRACTDLARIRAAHPGEDLFISVNVSPAELGDPDFAEGVVTAVREAGLPAGAVHLELTEATLAELLRAAEVLRRLRETGLRLVVDDFGAGYASIGMLTRLPIAGVKLDRSLVVDVADDPVARERLAAVLGLIRSLGIEHVVAAGVETPGQEAVLLDLGCPAVQGWLYGRELTVDDVLAGGGPGAPLGSGRGAAPAPVGSTASGVGPATLPD